MAFLPSFKKKNEIVVTPVFRTEAARQLAERFENVRNIADPTDRLLMLEKLETEISAFKEAEGAIKYTGHDTLKLMGVMGGSAVVAGAAGVLIFGPLGMLLAIAGEIVSIPVAWKVADNDRKKYDIRFKDYAVAEDIALQIARIKTEIIENTDVHVIADSPNAANAFMKFPSLKEKFLLSIAIEKSREDRKAALQVPDLGKITKNDPDGPKVKL